MTAIVLDAEAMSLLARPEPASAEVMAAVKAAANVRKPVIVPAVVLAELYRGPARVAAVNSLLRQKEYAVSERDTDRGFASLVGGVLHGASAGSVDMVDAHCVATAVENGGGVVITSDIGDLERLAAPYANVHVEAVHGPST